MNAREYLCIALAKFELFPHAYNASLSCFREAAVQPVERRAHWERVYEEKKPAEVSWFQAEPAVSLELIGHCRLAPSDPIVDVGGGASVLVDRLLERSYSQIAVLDVSAKALAVAKRRLGDDAARVTWIESDVTAWEPTMRFALWHDRAVFHFLTDAEDRSKYVSILRKALHPGGHVVIAAFALAGPEQCSGLPIVRYDSAKLLSELGPEFSLVEERTEEHVTPAGRTQPFAWFRLVRGASG